jgi:hypothetical protein
MALIQPMLLSADRIDDGEARRAARTRRVGRLAGSPLTPGTS